MDNWIGSQEGNEISKFTPLEFTRIKIRNGLFSDTRTRFIWATHRCWSFGFDGAPRYSRLSILVKRIVEIQFLFFHYHKNKSRLDVFCIDKQIWRNEWGYLADSGHKSAKRPPFKTNIFWCNIVSNVESLEFPPPSPSVIQSSWSILLSARMGNWINWDCGLYMTAA